MTTSSKQAAMKYTITQSRLLYVLSIDDKKHRGLLKIGEVFVDNNVADDTNTENLKQIVRDILDRRSYMQGIKYALEYVEVTTYAQEMKCYKAEDVHRMLIKQGVERKALGKIDKREADYWFECELDKVKAVLKKIKSGEEAKKEIFERSDFRPEQLQAINETVEYFEKDSSKGKGYLWNAKMRFGKTLCGLEVASELKAKSTLIITHRPVVDKGWRDDFQKIFGGRPEYKYATRMSDEDAEGGDFYALTKAVEAGKTRLVFFVSMQYLRLSQFVGGKEQHFDPLKKAIMQYDWDFIMVDEAHEGIEADAGIRVMEKLKKDNTRILSLSGTPFNLLEKYEESEIYTWDYVMEQREKLKWDDEHFGDPNPYADLPRMQILTFTLPKMLRAKAAENNETFHFHHFFHVWTEDEKNRLQKQIELEDDPEAKSKLQKRYNGIVIGRFEHEKEINRFLDKLVEESDTSQYPFSTDEFRERFRHTFWILPGVKEAAEMERLLRKHKIFGESGMFHIINAAGDGNIEDLNGSALAEVLDNIRGYDPSKDENRKRAAKKKAVEAKERTITLSCGKLTTGVSVPEWTAVLCMKGSVNTPAANYMQTIFRVQTPAVLNGRQKSDCYVFDFAPDRALTAVAETAKFSVYARDKSEKKKKSFLKLSQKKEEEQLDAFIKLCPVLSMDEGSMGKHITAGQIFEKLSNVYIERAVRSGYSDNSIYNPETLLNLTPEQEKALGDVHALLGKTANVWKPDSININNNGISGAKNASQVKYVYLLTNNPSIPPKPIKSAEVDKNGCPKAKDWDDEISKPCPLYPYLFISHSDLIDGIWTNFSTPVLRNEYEEPDPEEEEARRRRNQENQEKRARMSVLRGVAIRIPLLVYGAEINDDNGEEITVDNFTSLVDDTSWEEYMPKGFKKETFDLLKECFDRSVFTGAPKRIRAMVKEADSNTIEERIDKIATIFSYFHNPDKETVLTPWRVVNMHLSSTLGGYCFLNDAFDGPNTTADGEPTKEPRWVEQPNVTNNIFKTVSTLDGKSPVRILEINSKTGLYPLYMAYSLYRSIRPVWLQVCNDPTAPNAVEGNVLWSQILQENIFVICNTPMAASITRRTLRGFQDVPGMHIRSIQLIEEATKDQKTLVKKLNSENFWFGKGGNNQMKFNAIVGNPPYQLVTATQQAETNGQAPSKSIFQLFQIIADQITTNITSLIYPGARWMHRSGKGMEQFGLDQINDKKLASVDFWPDSTEIFEDVGIADGITIVLKNIKKDKSGFTYTFHKDGVAISVQMQPPGKALIALNPMHDSIVKKVEAFVKKNGLSYINSKILPRSLFGIESDFVEKNPDKVRRYSPDDIFPIDYDSEIKLLANDKAGKAGKSTWYVAKRDVIQVNQQYIGEWQVVVSSANAGGQKRDSQLEIIDNHSAFGRSRVALASFKTEEEARNFYNFTRTALIRFMYLMTDEALTSLGKRVPDLLDYTSKYKLIDFSKDLNEQLYSLVDLNDEEKQVIESTIRPIE